MKSIRPKPKRKGKRSKVPAAFWASVLSLAIILPLAGLSDRRDEAPADRGLAVVPEDLRDVDRMLRESFVALRGGHYEAAILSTDQVLRVEPANVTAMELQGSALFFMNERGQAKVILRRALELEPENRAVSALLGKI